MNISTRRILALAAPAVFSMVSFNIMQFADRAFLSRYDSAHFAAVLPSGMISFTLLSFFLGVAQFVGALSSQYTGAEQRGAAARSAWQGLIFAFGAGLLILVTAFPASRVFGLLGHEAHLAALEGVFYRWMCVAGFFNLLAGALGGYFSGLGDTRTPMIASIAGHVLNIALDWVFIFGHFGFPAMGIAGAGIATTLATALNFAILAAVFLGKRQRVEHETWSRRGFDPGLFRRLIRFGTPAGFQFFLDMAGWGVMTLFLGRLGETALMAVNISITFESLAFMIAVGVATAASILAGQARGAGKNRAVGVIIRRSVTLLVFYEVFIMVLFLGFPHLLVSFFVGGSDPAVYDAVREQAVPILRITGVWIAVDAVRILFASVLRVLGDTVFLMTAYGVGSVVIISATASLVLWAPNPLFWVWVTILAWVAGMWTVMWARFRSGHWKKIKLIGE
jgi:MATE family multidrug resistance protein